MTTVWSKTRQEYSFLKIFQGNTCVTSLQISIKKKKSEADNQLFSLQGVVTELHPLTFSFLCPVFLILLVPGCLPQIHKIDQVSQLSYHGHQRAPRNHNHSLPLPRPQKSETLSRLDSRALPPGASHNPPGPDSCYHQTEHVNTDLWAWFQLSAGHHTLNRERKKKKK